MTCQVSPPFQARSDRGMCHGTSIRLAHRFLTRPLPHWRHPFPRFFEAEHFCFKAGLGPRFSSSSSSSSSSLSSSIPASLKPDTLSCTGQLRKLAGLSHVALAILNLGRFRLRSWAVAPSAFAQDFLLVITRLGCHMLAGTLMLQVQLAFLFRTSSL